MAYDVWQSCMLVPGFSRSECASWVQAWGSIGAILATAWGVHRAHRLQQREKDREAFDGYTRLLESAYEITKGARDCALLIADIEKSTVHAPDVRRVMYARMVSLRDAFSRLDVSRLEGSLVVRAVLGSNALSHHLVANIEAAEAEGRKTNAALKVYIHLKAKEIQEALTENVETLAIALRDRRTQIRR